MVTHRPDVGMWYSYVLFRVYVSTINILWSVVYITGYKEKDKLLNWACKKGYTDMHLNLYRNWLTTASGSYEW
jgi:hypothetical protein